MSQNIHTEDATVNAMVGLGGKMLSSRILLDSGADFSCVSNRALLRMRESGINLSIQSSLGQTEGVAANGSPLKVVGKINLFNLH